MEPGRESDHFNYIFKFVDFQGSEVSLRDGAVAEGNRQVVPYPTMAWDWTCVQSYALQQSQHINVLGMVAFFNYLRFYAQAPCLLHVFASRVCSCIMGNGRSSSSKLNLLESLDNLSYRVIGLGFPLLTIGIIAGAVWANEAWGAYWSWDPKETWALITWLVFAAYLHARITKAWQGKKPAILAAVGFVVVWICYLGVNFLGKGLHSYGWIL